MNRGSVVLVSLVLMACPALAADDATALSEAELKGLAERALTAAVTSSGKTTFALEDSSVQSEGAAKSEDVATALRAGAAKAGAKIVKHSEHLDALMLHARLSRLIAATSRDTIVDHGLYIELEAPNRQILHANVTNVHKTGPGGRTSGHHTAETLDGFADRFLAKWQKEPLDRQVTFVGRAQSNSIAQQCLVERINERLVGAKATVVASRTGSVDVERPKDVKALGTQVGLIVTLSDTTDVLFIDGTDLSNRAVVMRYRDPPPGGAGNASPVIRMEKLAKTAEYQFRNGGYRVKTAGPKGKAWVLEARIEAGHPESLRQQLTSAVRNVLNTESPRWIFEAHDGETTSAEAKKAGIDLLVTPIFRTAKNGMKEVQLEIRTTADDTVIDAQRSDWLENPQQPPEPKK